MKKVRNEAMRRVHWVIVKVGSRKMSVDEGFSRVVRLLTGSNTYLSLTFKEKVDYLMYIAGITYQLEDGWVDKDKDALGAMLEVHYSDC